MDSVGSFLDIPGYETYHSVRVGKKMVAELIF